MQQLLLPRRPQQSCRHCWQTAATWLHAAAQRRQVLLQVLQSL
jgi:hypothetical protein